MGLEVHSRTTLFYPQGYLGLSVFPRAMGPAAGVAKGLNLNMEQFKALFAKFTQGILPAEKIGWTADALGNLEKLTKRDIQELNQVLVFGSQG